jgi:hypothetical protein
MKSSNYDIIEDYDDGIIIKPSKKKRSRLLCNEIDIIENENEKEYEFISPKMTIKKDNEWLCQYVPCIIISKTNETYTIRPFNKYRKYIFEITDIKSYFNVLKNDKTYVYVDGYPGDKIEINEFFIEKIDIISLKKHFKNNNDLIALLDKAKQDSYNSKGNQFCINFKNYDNYKNNKNNEKTLERVGDAIFNRSSRHTYPIKNTYSRKDFEKSLGFPAPVGINIEDFAFPSEQNKIFKELITQIFNCLNAPIVPEKIQNELNIRITPNSHKCLWCGIIVDINNLKQEYCSIEHTINFCHKDPAIGTKLNNVYIGHCVCNREQGGYSEIERVKQIIRLCKNNDNYKKLFLSEIN